MMIRTPKMRLPSQLSYYILYPKVPYIIRMKLRVYCQKGELSNLRTDWKYPRALWVYEALWKRGPQTEYMSMLMSVSVAVATSKCCWQNKFPFDDLDDLLWHNFFCKYFWREQNKLLPLLQQNFWCQFQRDTTLLDTTLLANECIKSFLFFPFEDFRSTDLFYRMTNSIGIMEKIWKNVKKKAGWGLRKIVVPFFSSTTALILKCDNNSLDRVPRFPFVLFHSHTSRTHSRRKPHLRAPV